MKTPGAGKQKGLPPVNLKNALFNGVMNKYLSRFEKVMKQKGAKDLQTIGVRITEGYLRFEANLSIGSTGTIQFAVVEGDQSPNANATANPNEQRLAKTDEFVIESYSFQLAKSATTSIANLTIMKPDSYPDPAIFTGSGEAANLYSIYNGNLFIQIDGIVWTQQGKMLKYLYIPETQQGTTNANPVSEWWENSTVRDGYPSITLRGNGKNVIQVNLGSSINLALNATTNTNNWLIMQVDGYLVQNASKFATQG